MVYNSPSRSRLRGGVWLAAALLVLAAVPSALAFQAKAKHMKPKRAARQTVENMEEQWRQATLDGDADALDRLLSDDYVGITAAGEVLTKAQQLARIRDRKAMLTDIELSDVKVKQIGPIVAVVISRAQVKGTNNGNPIQGLFRYTRVYQRLASGQWKMTSSEATRARPEINGDGEPRGDRPAKRRADSAADPHA